MKNKERILGILLLCFGLSCSPMVQGASLSQSTLSELLGELNEARAALKNHQCRVMKESACSVDGQMDVCQALCQIDRSRNRILPLLRDVALTAQHMLFTDGAFQTFLKERLGDEDRIIELEAASKQKLYLMQEGAWACEPAENLATILRNNVRRSLRRLEDPEDLNRVFGTVELASPVFCADETLVAGGTFTLRARVEAKGWDGVGCPGGTIEVVGLDGLILHGHHDRDDYFQTLEVFARGRIPWSARAGDVLRVRLRFDGYAPFFVHDGCITPSMVERIVEIPVHG